MANATKILITTESHETFILSVTSKKRAVGQCSQCEKEVEMLSVDQAVSATGVKTSELVRRIESNEIHGIETGSGHLLICARSLAIDIEVKGVGK